MAGFWTGFAQGMENSLERRQEERLQKQRLDEAKSARQEEFDFRTKMQEREEAFTLRRLGVEASLEEVARRRKLVEEDALQMQEQLRMGYSILGEDRTNILASTGRLPDFLDRFKEEKRTPELIEAISANIDEWSNMFGEETGLDIAKIAAEQGISAANEVVASMLVDKEAEISPLVLAPRENVAGIDQRFEIAKEQVAGLIGARTTVIDGKIELTPPKNAKTSDVNNFIVDFSDRVGQLQPKVGFERALQMTKEEFKELLPAYNLDNPNTTVIDPKVVGSPMEATQSIIDSTQKFTDDMLDEMGIK